MLINEKQLIGLLYTLRDSLRINDDYQSYFALDKECREFLHETIMKQQSENLINVGNDIDANSANWFNKDK